MTTELSFRGDHPQVPSETNPWDDDPWEVFVPDEDQLDPLPESGDFWTDDDGADYCGPRLDRRESQPCCH